MLLCSAPASPFARKIRIAVAHLGFEDRVAIVPTDTGNPDQDFLRRNPLGKIPTLVLNDGTTLFDSSVIAAYLDELAGGGKLIPRGPARFQALRLEALADGVMDAIVLIVYERRWRPEERREPRWIAHQEGKIERGLTEAEQVVSQEHGPDVHIGHISLASALGYLDLRFEGAWRTRHSGLVPWLDAFAARVPAFEKTRYVDPQR